MSETTPPDPAPEPVDVDPDYQPGSMGGPLTAARVWALIPKEVDGCPSGRRHTRR